MRLIFFVIIIIVVITAVAFYFSFFVLEDFKQLIKEREGTASLSSPVSLLLKQLFKPRMVIGQKEEISQNQADSPAKKSSFSSINQKSPASEPEEPKSAAVSINTYIVSGPKEGEIIEETRGITFEFEAVVFPKNTEGQIIFQTKIEELEKDWQEIHYSNQKTINFPPGPKEYTFLVRAKINNTVDPVPAKRTFKINNSPYSGKIKIYRIQTPASRNPYALITLKTDVENGKKINITGWQIKGSKGNFTIPRGVEKYEAVYNLIDKSQIPVRDIFVKGYEFVYLSEAPNPLGSNINFKPNKCFGYLTNYYSFPIPVYKNCPKLNTYEERFIEELARLGTACQKYVLSLNYCELPKHWESPGVATDPECVAYLNENFNYQGCFKNYSGDNDFLNDEWHIYMNRNFNIGILDVFYLKDEGGLLVDKYLYKQF